MGDPDSHSASCPFLLLHPALPFPCSSLHPHSRCLFTAYGKAEPRAVAALKAARRSRGLGKGLTVTQASRLEKGFGQQWVPQVCAFVALPTVTALTYFHISWEVTEAPRALQMSPVMPATNPTLKMV